MSDENCTPTIMAPAIELLHPMLFDPNTKEQIPPPPDHTYAIGLSLCIGRPDSPLQNSPRPIWISGTDPEHMGQLVKDLIIKSCGDLDSESSLIKPATFEEQNALRVLHNEELSR